MNKTINKNEYPRHLTRRAVLQAMYEHLVNDENNIDILIKDVLQFDNIPESSQKFFSKLLECSLDREHLADSVIKEVAENWELERINIIDRNILRIGIAEFLDFPKISPKVTIDEAVELAKEFGNKDSTKFVNGVLDAALRKLMKMKLIKKED